LNVLVTGGAGFIGANLCRELERRPQIGQVVVIDDLSTGYADNLAGTGAKLIEGSILERDLLDELVPESDAVVHLAARPSVPRSLVDPETSHDVNATGTVRVLEACRRAGVHLIAASSSSVYGVISQSPKREDLATRPLSPYGASKLATEAYVLAYGAGYGLPTLALRFFNVYGPLQAAGHPYAAAVPTFIDAALRGRPLHIHGDGRQTRDFTYIGVVVRVLADAIVGRVTCESPINLALGTRTSVLELAHEVAAAVGRPVEIRHGPARRGDIRESQADGALLNRMFPGVERVLIEVGLRQTVEWFQGLPEFADSGNAGWDDAPHR
jgi:UDP-glucose 4-epimerase